MPFPDAVGQVLVGRGDEPDIDCDRAGSPDPLEFPFLQDAQQFDLHRRRTLADLIEEQRTAIGDLETSGFHLHGLGKCAFLMAKELAFQHALCQRRAIDFDEGFFPARTVLVDRTGNELFPSAAFPADEHGRMGWRDGLYPAKDRLHLRAFTHDLVKAVTQLVFSAQVCVFLTETASCKGLFNFYFDLFERVRFGYKIHRSLLHGLNGQLDRAKSRHHYDTCFGRGLGNGCEDFEPGLLWHLDIDHGQIERILPDRGDRILSVKCNMDRMPQPPKREGEPLSGTFMVVGDQYPAHARLSRSRVVGNLRANVVPSPCLLVHSIVPR